MLQSLDERQLSTTLAALRLYQLIADGKSPTEALVMIDDIATDGGNHAGLTASEIDIFCEAI